MRGKMPLVSRMGALAMRRSLWIIAVLSVLAADGSGAQALDAEKILAISKAADTFAELGKDSHKTGRPPRQSDAAAKPLLDLVFNTAELENGPPVAWQDVPGLNAWNTAAIKIGMVYFLAGTGVADLDALRNDARAADRANRNTVEFAPEFGRYSDAQLHLQAAVIDAVQAYVATAPQQHVANARFQADMARIGAGVAQTIIGLFGSFVVEGTTDEWRLARLAVATSIAPKTAKFLLPQDRQNVQYAAVEVAEYVTDPAMKAGLTALSETFAP
jgi:hypothetical protein